MTIVMADGRKLIVVAYLGKFYALGSTCPYADGPLDHGRLAGGDLVLPWHGARFSVKNGTPITGPASDKAKSYGVAVQGDETFVNLGPL
jgi:3-phenylpropionate/trans-cinnamate dioxygenase ferredoxin subunit